MASSSQFGALLGNVNPSASNDRNVQIAIKLSEAWRLTALCACVYRATMPRTTTPIGFRLVAGIGSVPTTAVVTPASDTIAASGGTILRRMMDTVGQAETPIIYTFGALDMAPVIEAGQSFFALVGQMLYSDASVSPVDGDTGSIMVYGVPVNPGAVDVKFR